MQYLLDTHVILWWLLNPKKLSQKARTIIADRRQKIFASSVSFWEMAIKSDIGRLTLPNNMIELLQQESIELLSMSAEDGLAVADLPKIHNDPFDRLLIVQAKRYDMVLITHDATIMKYPVTTVKA